MKLRSGVRSSRSFLSCTQTRSFPGIIRPTSPLVSNWCFSRNSINQSTSMKHGIRQFASAQRPARPVLPTPSDPPKQVVHLENDKKCAYTDVGPRDGPIIVCVHGAPGSTWDFRYLGGILEDHARVIRLDLPGHGDTPVESCMGADAAGNAEFIFACLRAIGIASHERFFLLGHSLGGDLCFHMAAHHPEHIAGMILINSIGVSAHRGISPAWLKVNLLHTLITLPIVGHSVLLPCVRQLYIKALGFSPRTTQEEVLRSQERIVALSYPKIRENIAKMRQNNIPTLIAYSTDDPLIEENIYLGLTHAAPDGPRLRFDFGGHYLQKHQATPIAEEILAWIDDKTIFAKL